VNTFPEREGGVTRRQFLRVGAMGALALSTVSLTALLSGCASSPRPQGFKVLRESDLAILRALAPVVLAGQLPAGEARPAALDDLLRTLDEFLAGSSAATQTQLGQLFDLLHMPVTRYAVAGLSSPWEEADRAALEKFLAHWRNSRFEMLRAGYGALTQMLNMMWYFLPQSWAAIGYVPPHVVPANGAPAPVVLPATPAADPDAAARAAERALAGMAPAEGGPVADGAVATAAATPASARAVAVPVKPAAAR
jgi:hypothetical protein